MVSAPTPEPRLKFAKPEKRRTTKGRKDRAEVKVEQKVRAECVERDGDCRLKGVDGANCRGESEWAHLDDKKRARTRGMAPEERHTAGGSLMLCTFHHASYDNGGIDLEPLIQSVGANGRLGYRIVRDRGTC